MTTSMLGGGYAAPTEPVDRQIVGQLTAYENRSNGWVRFSIQEQGRQYPVKVDTKKQEIIQIAMALGGQIVVAAVREQQSEAINPHNGQPYTNRYLNEIALAGTQQPVMQPQPQPQPQSQGWGQNTGALVPTQPQPQPQPMQQIAPALTGAEKDLDIHRQVAWKCSCALAAGGVIEPTPVALVEAAEVAMAYFEYGPLRFGVTPYSGAPSGGHPFDDPLPPGQGAAQFEQNGAACPDCGYPPPDHAFGCPRGDAV